jgi:hypothetical protein
VKIRVDPGYDGMVASWGPVLSSSGLLCCWYSLPGLFYSWKSVAGFGVCVVKFYCT